MVAFVKNMDDLIMIKKLTRKEMLKIYPNVSIESKISEMPKNKKVKIKCPLESSEAKTFWAWAQYHPIAKLRLFAIPNGGSRNILEAKNMKATGVKSGVSDYMLAYPHNGKAGMFIELKRANKSISSLTLEQAEWLAQSERVGYATKCAYGADEAIKAVEEYLR